MRHHDAGDGADRGGEPPAQRQHPVDAHADQPRHLRVLRRRAHGEPERREAEEHEQQASTISVTSIDAELVRPDDAGDAEAATCGNGDGNSLISVAPDRAGHRVEDRQQADEHHDDRQDRRVVQRSQDHPLDDARPARRRSATARTKATQKLTPQFMQLPADVGR